MTAATASSNQIAFVLDNLLDLGTLLANMPVGTEVYLLDAQGDALAQMAGILADRSGVDTIHLFSHGGPGSLSLGQTTLSGDTLASHADALAAIRGALSENADLLLYGCDVAAGANGQSFVDALALATGADVAASTDLTGAASLGGDWVLETTTGSIEATPVDAPAMQAVLGADSQLPTSLNGSPATWGGTTFQTRYNGSIDDTDPENPLKPGNLWDRYVLNGVSNGTVVKVYMGNSSTVDDYIQIGRNGSVVVQNDDAGDGERSYDAFVSWTYQAGDVIHATTFSPGYRGSYSLWISVGGAGSTPPTVTDIGSAPVPSPTAPTFTDSFGTLGTVADTSALDTSLAGFSGTLTATDSTPTGTMSFSGGGTQTYGTLSVASGGGFTFTPNATNINTLAAGATASNTFAVSVSDGSLSSSKNITVNFTGVNDLPTLTSNAVAMPGILEDAGSINATNSGATVSALFGSRFSDVDAGATFKGVYIVSNAAVAGEGVWEYSTNNGSTWTAVTASTTLLAAYKVHFVPAANWSGTPGALTVKAIDNNDGQSAGTATLGITVTAVNDLPTFTSTAGTYTTGTGSYADTSGDDTVFTATTGTLTAGDVDSTLVNAFSVRGATLATDTWTAQGIYGTLTLDRSTGAWSYTPDKLATINALPAGQTVHDRFDFKVTDPAGGSNTQALDITITGSNDTPVVASAIVDQTFSGAGAWTYQIPAATVTDAEGAGLTYTVEVVDGAGAPLDVGSGAGVLPAWLTFDEASRTFSGDPTLAWADAALNFKVTATDPAGVSVSDTFTLTLTNTANQPPVVANPITWHAEATVKEITEVQFGSGTLGGQTVTFAGTTVTAGVQQTGAEVASAVVAAGATTNYNVAAKSGSPDTVIYTAKALNDVVDTTYADVIGAGTYNGTATVTKVADGTAGANESFTITFGANGASVTMIAFNGTNIGIPSNATAVDVANLVANVVGGFTNWTAVQGTTVGTNDNQVTFTQMAPGNVPDVVLATDFTGNFNYTGTSMGPITQGTGYETFEVQYTGGYSGSTLIFDSVTATAGSALTGDQVASAVVTGNYAGYTDAVKSGATDTVVFTATASGNPTNVVAGDITGTNAGSKTVTVTDGGGWSYTVPANTFTDPENDTLTYTAWTVSGGNATQITTTSGANAINFDPATRILSGDGTALPSNTIEIRATDASGSNTTVSTQFGLFVDNGTDSAVTAGTTIADQTWSGAGSKTFQIPADAFAFDDAAPDALVFSATADGAVLPDWLTLDPATGKFSGNPPANAPAALAIVVTATPQVGTTTAATSAFTLNIATPNDAPVLTAPLADQLVAEGSDWSVSFGANIFSDPDGSATGTASTGSVTYTATLADGSALPSWITYTAATNTFSGTPPGGVPYLNILVTGTDTGGVSASSTFTLNLQDPNAASSTGALTANNVGAVTISGASSGSVNEGQTLTAVRPTDADGLAAGTTVNYQWQVSTDSGANWTDIAGARGQAQTLTPDNSEAGTGKQVRVQAFYTDNGGVAESPVSTAISVANVDDTGTVTITGGLSAGSVLTATISDSDGLINVTPTYIWQRTAAGGASNSSYTNIPGATDSSAYTVTADDGDRYIRVLTSYTDNQGTSNSPQSTTVNPIMRGAVPPVAVDDTATVTEAGGLANATPGSNVVAGDARNLLSNDTDLNAADTKAITEVRLGGNEGSGAMASNDGSIYTLVGQYGTLTVKMGLSTAGGGVYTYTVNQDNEQVNALATGATLTDTFNYQVSDSTANTDYGLLTVTVTGANDAPTVSGLRESSTVVEDLAGFIRTDMILVDPDLGAGANFALKLSVGSGRLIVSNVTAANTAGISIKGDDTGTLTLTGNMGTVSGWLQGDVIKYVAPANVLGAASATLTLSANDGGGFATLGTMAINVSPANDAPRLDLDADNSSSSTVPSGSAALGTGDNFVTTFRPRGAAVSVVDGDVTISDVDAADTLMSATVAITAGDLDNEFGTIFETLTASGGNSYTGSLGIITVSGNGTKALTLTGAGTHADYQNLLKTITYINNNPNAYSGDRTITISVSDTAQIASTVGADVAAATAFTIQTANANIVAGLHIFKNGSDTGITVLSASGTNITTSGAVTLTTTETLTFASNGAASASNLASFTAGTANTAIAVGQKIYLAGADTGQTVAVVIDSTHFIASGPLSGLTPTSALSFATTAAVGTPVSNAASFTVETANSSIATGLHIYKNGADTGFTVTSVSGTTIGASGSITLAASDVLSFQTTATNSAPLAATTTVRVPWTSVVDMDGTASGSRDYTTSYTEGAQPISIATSTASIDNQAINIKTFSVTLTNPLDGTAGASEELSVSASMVATLLNKGVVVTVSADKHMVTFTASNATLGATATDMQLGLRAIKYINLDQNPSITPRIISTYVLDVANETGVTATTTINIVPVNDAPVKGGDYAGALNEGDVYVVTNANLNSTDVDDAPGTLKYILTAVPDAVSEGTLFRDSNNNNVVDAGEALLATTDTSSVTLINAIASDGYFTQSEVNAGQIKYLQSGANPDGTNATGTDTFGFKVVDGMEDYAFANIAANQAGTVTLTVTEVNDLPTGTPVVSGTMTPGQVLTVDTTSIADADGPAPLTFSYQWQTYNGTVWENATGTGNTTASYTLDAADQGKQVKVEVSFPDAFARPNTLTGAATGTVAFTNTTGAGAVTITDDGTPQAGETLTADTSGLTDADGLGPVSYQWQVYDIGTSAWVDVAGAISKTYALPTDAATGAKYKVAVSYTDGRGNTENVESAEKVLVAPAADINDAPLLTGDGAFPATTQLFSNVAVNTVESAQTLKTLTLTVSGLQDGAAEKVTIDGVEVDLATAATTAITGGTIDGVSYAIVMAGTSPDTATITLTHAGLSEANTKSLVEGLALSGGTTAGLRVVTLTSLQDSGGGSDTGTIGISATVDVGNTLPGSNTTPTVTTGGAFNTATVAEGGVVTLAGTQLAATDTEQADGLKVVLASDPTNGTLFRDLNGNGLVDGTETALVSGSKFALADIAAGRIKYLHDGSETTTDAFSFNVSDGLALSDADGVTVGDQATTFTITVNAVNEAPTLTVTAAGIPGTPVAFAEGDAAKAMFTAANASTVDTGQNITELTVMVSGLRDGAAEALLVDGSSIALTHGINGTSTGGSTIGYAVSVTGGTATVTLTKTAVAGDWNGFINGLAYENTSQNPTAGQRSVTLTKLTDNGADHNTADLELTSVVAVTAVNDAPTLTPADITVTEGGSLTLTTTHAAAADADDALTTLTYTLSTAPSQGWVYIDGNGDGIKGAGEALAADGTFTHAQLTAGQVRYAHNGSELGDAFALTVKDPANATSAAQSITVNRTATNDAPTLSGLGSDVLTYPANSGAKTLEQGADAVVGDADSANFSGGSLRVAVSFNRDPAHDVLSIENVGTGTGQISVSAGIVSYAGTQIGTFTGGTGTADLVVTFDADATLEAVTALVKAIQFSNDQAAPALTSRSVSFTLNDGNTNGEAAPVAVNVNLQTGVTPSISIGNGFFVTENTQSVTTLSATDGGYGPVTFSIDTAVDAINNPDAAKFEIVSGNLLRLKTAPDYEIPDDAGADRTYNVVVKATNSIGSSATQAVSVSVLNQDPEEGIAPGDTSGPVFGFASVNGSTLTMTYSDASNLDATNIPAANAFTVNVGGSANTVTNVAVNAANKTVTLTLTNAVAFGAAVTVAYADPTAGDDANAIQDVGGYDAVTLAATSVSNLAASSGGSSSGTGTGTTTGTSTSTVDGTTVDTASSQDGNNTVTTRTVAPVTTTRQEDTSTPHSNLADIPLATNGSGETVVQVSLPTGVGLTSQAITGTGSTTLRDLLIAASSPKVTDATVFSKIVADGIDAYIPDVQDQSQVTVRTVALSAGSSSAGQTILVSGALGTGENSNLYPLRQEALVIDTRTLPTDAKVQLDNVEFAIVVGVANLIGGSGNNFVVGDNASQNIYSGDGNDNLTGGGSSDFIHGGKDSDKGLFSGSSDRYQVTYDYGRTIVTSLDNPSDVVTLINVENLKFSDQTLDVTSHTQSLSWVATVYRQALGRQADLGGFQGWSEQTASGMMSDGAATLDILRSAEMQQKSGIDFNGLDVASQIEFLYTQLLGRQSDAAGKDLWMQQYANGVSMSEIAQGFVHSVELTGQYMAATEWDFFV